MGYQLKLNNNKKFIQMQMELLRVAYGKVSSYEPADGIEYSIYNIGWGQWKKRNPRLDEFNIHPKFKNLYMSKRFWKIC